MKRRKGIDMPDNDKILHRGWLIFCIIGAVIAVGMSFQKMSSSVNANCTEIKNLRQCVNDVVKINEAINRRQDISISLLEKDLEYIQDGIDRIEVTQSEIIRRLKNEP